MTRRWQQSGHPLAGARIHASCLPAYIAWTSSSSRFCLKHYALKHSADQVLVVSDVFVLLGAASKVTENQVRGLDPEAAVPMCWWTQGTLLQSVANWSQPGTRKNRTNEFHIKDVGIFYGVTRLSSSSCPLSCSVLRFLGCLSAHMYTQYALCANRVM